MSDGRRCPPGCECGKHSGGSRPCEPGCECGRHRNGSKRCKLGCQCDRHRRDQRRRTADEIEAEARADGRLDEAAVADGRERSCSLTRNGIASAPF